MNIFEFNEDADPREEEEDEKETKDLVSYEDIKDNAWHALARSSAKAGIELSTGDAAELMGFMKDSRFGHQASLTMICKGDSCGFINICPLKKINATLPLDKQCQPPGTKVLAIDRSRHSRDSKRLIYVSIEDLRPDLHRVISYSRKKSTGGGSNTLRTKGREFSLHSRRYSGELISITAGGHSHKCTKDHISIVKWNEKAIDKFVVYLMRKDGRFRIGTTKLIWISDNEKLHSGIAARCRAEKADSMWVLGTYDTNSEALLYEESFSIQAQIPKALFIASDNKSTRKYSGLYRWVNQEQLDEHHTRCALPEHKYSEFLFNLGLSIESPLYRYKSGQMIGGTSSSFETATCNIISGLMDVSIFEPPFAHNSKGRWAEATTKREYYSGYVYSLDVDKDSTYVSNNIVTHNCPVEDALVEQWVSMYMESLGLDKEDPSNAFEVHMVYELAGVELIRRRAANELSKNPDLVKNDIVGFSPQGQPIYDDKPSQALLILERHSKIVNKLRDSLLATPKAAAQAGQITSDLSTRTANIAAKARAIAEKRRSGKSIADVDFQVIDDEESAKNKQNEDK